MARTPLPFQRRHSLLSVASMIGIWLSVSGCGTSPGTHSFQPAPGYRLVELGAAMVVVTDSEQSLRETLEQTASMNYKDLPLDLVLRDISLKYSVPVVMDQSIVDDQGTDVPITYAGSGISLRAALKTMLEQIEATYWIANEALVIGTLDAAEDNIKLRVYYVKDLVEVVHPPSGPPAEALLGWSTGPAASGGLKGRYWPDYDSLIDLIETVVEPESWDSVGGPGSMEEFPQRHCLAISQTQDVHEQLEDLFRRLRSIPRY